MYAVWLSDDQLAGVNWTDIGRHRLQIGEHIPETKSRLAPTFSPVVALCFVYNFALSLSKHIGDSFDVSHICRNRQTAWWCRCTSASVTGDKQQQRWLPWAIDLCARKLADSERSIQGRLSGEINEILRLTHSHRHSEEFALLMRFSYILLLYYSYAYNTIHVEISQGRTEWHFMYFILHSYTKRCNNSILMSWIVNTDGFFTKTRHYFQLNPAKLLLFTPWSMFHFASSQFDMRVGYTIHIYIIIKMEVSHCIFIFD